MQYRLATPSDAEAIASLHADSWRRTYRGLYADEFLDGDLPGERRRVWRDRLASPRDDQLVYVAADEAGLAGFVCAFGGEDPEWGSLIDNLHVSHDRRRAGIASVLLAHTGSWLAPRWPERGVYLWVLEANTGARRFYERLGAANAGAVEMVNASGGVGRSCRYVWPSPAALARRAADADS